MKVCVELDKFSCEKIRVNLSNITLVERNVGKIMGSELLDLASIQTEELKLLPPWQSFSTVGRRRSFKSKKGLRY